VETGPVSFEVVPVDKPADMNVIIGQAHGGALLHAI
jgi:adenosine/AMP kinase